MARHWDFFRNYSGLWGIIPGGAAILGIKGREEEAKPGRQGGKYVLSEK